MTLIAILISLGVEKSVAMLQEFRQFDWFTNFARWLRARLARGAGGSLGVLLIVGLPVLAIGILYHVLNDLLGLLGFAFATLVLIFSLGPQNLDEQVQAYIDAREIGDTEAAHHIATDILHEQLPGSAFQLTRAVTESILVQANERVLAVLFWFAVLGPVGAILYRLSCILRNGTAKEQHPAGEFAQAATRLHATLDWVPARLAALGYAVSGSFVDAIGNWRGSAGKWAGNWEASSVGVLLASGMGALQLDVEHAEGATELDVQGEINQIKSAQALIWRTLVVWILIIALMTLAGWAG
ncbi:MAG TPA: regulatory signaling modulator protein AmpE [Gammaproteobacteria bacterium]|nr:regulatory signaling modulator protein AmpE [Gammaproteobacteria bacterium]